MMRFEEFGFNKDIMEGIRTMNFEEATPVQEQTIPVIMEGRDLIGCAQTGTGKTAAYTLPLLDKLLREGNPDNVVKSLIVVPTRELAQQIDVQFQGFSYFLPVSTTVVYGGGDGVGWSEQKQGMLMGADIVIATPGRLLAHITNSGVDLSHVGYFVLDEADRMLDMGFFDDIMKIVAELPKERQTIMFSATLPPKIRQMAKQIMRNPAEVNIAVSKPNEAIEQRAYVCYESQKMEIIRDLFAESNGMKSIIFASSKQKVKELAHALKRMKLNVAAMHSDLEQEQREAVMLDFKNGKVDILVATDIVARGIDIEDIGTVINYDVPRDPEDYIHRIGRTARAAATGTAITFVSEKEQGMFHRIETFIEREVEKAPLPERMGQAPIYNPVVGGRSGHGRGGQGRGGNRHRGRGDRRMEGRGLGREMSTEKSMENKPERTSGNGRKKAAGTPSNSQGLQQPSGQQPSGKPAGKRSHRRPHRRPGTDGAQVVSSQSRDTVQRVGHTQEVREKQQPKRQPKQQLEQQPERQVEKSNKRFGLLRFLGLKK